MLESTNTIIEEMYMKKYRWHVHFQDDTEHDIEAYAKSIGWDVDDIDPEELSVWEISVMNYKWDSYGWAGENKLIVASSDDYEDSEIPRMRHRAELIAETWNHQGVK